MRKARRKAPIAHMGRDMSIAVALLSEAWRGRLRGQGIMETKAVARHMMRRVVGQGTLKVSLRRKSGALGQRSGAGGGMWVTGLCG